LQKVNPLAVEE